MLGYTEADIKTTEVLKQYKKVVEGIKVSGIIEIDNNFYREVIFTKRNFLKMKTVTKGYLYLNIEDKAVTDRGRLYDLSKLSYYYEVFFSKDKAIGILGTLKTELDIQREKSNLKQICEGLDFLLTQNVYAAERVKSIFIKNYNLREKSNTILKELSDNITLIGQQDIKFNSELLSKLYPYYEDILKINFEKVVSIASIEDCIDVVIKEAEIKRKKWGTRVKGNMVGKLIKTSDELSYFKRLIELYRSVLQMNSNQYMKYLNNLDKDRIENMISLIRY